MDFEDKLYVVSLTFLVIPCIVPVGLVCLRLLFKWIEKRYFSNLFTKTVRYRKIRGEINNMNARIYNGAIFMAIPFAVASGYRLFFSDLTAFRYFLAATIALTGAYSVFRILLMRGDIKLHESAGSIFQEAVMLRLVHLNRAIICFAIFIWALATIVFYAMSPIVK